MKEIDVILHPIHDEEEFGLASRSPIEIFCPEKIGDYYVRGQEIVFGMEEVGFKKGKTTQHFYRVRLLVLVRENFQYNLKLEQWPFHYGFGVVFGKTKEEFDKIYNFRQGLLQGLVGGKLKQQARLWMGYQKKDIVEKSLSQLGVDPSVGARLPLSTEPFIFLGFSIDYDHSSGKLTDPILKSKFALISEGLINERTEEGINLVQLIRELSGMLQSRFQYKDLCLDELEALQYLFQCWQGIEAVSAVHLKWLNDIVPAFLGDLGLAEPWAAIILKDFTAHLIEQGDVCQCQHCGTFFPYQKQTGSDEWRIFENFYN